MSSGAAISTGSAKGLDEIDFPEAGRSQAPRVSVIVLNHNGERIVGKCLDHLLAQTFDDFEIVVIDNNSTDTSLAVLEKYLSRARISVVRSHKNLGVAGGRNLGVLHAQGSIIAFIDNDGYADPGWLTAAVSTMDSNPRIGMVASTVFFAARKIILNGAGGTLNLQGYGCDFCFDVPYEFAQLRDRVLYAMGCGMVVRRDVLDATGPLDELLFNYYDDSELGIRTWKAGYEVAVAPDAWIDHGFGQSDKIFGNKAFLCERNRIRTILKYLPVWRLPKWLIEEIVFCSKLRRELVSRMIRAWRWNLVHLPSAAWIRMRFLLKRGSFTHLMAPTWGYYPPPRPDNQAYHPDLTRALPLLVMDGKSDLQQLNFGWYELENDGIYDFRWSADRASALFRLRQPALSCTVAFLGLPSKRSARVVIRSLGSLEPLYEREFEMAPPGWTWRTFHMHLPAGCYEVQLHCDDEYTDAAGRQLGVAVSQVRFD